MKRTSLAAVSGFELHPKRTRKRVFLEEMNAVVPWDELVALIAPFTVTCRFRLKFDPPAQIWIGADKINHLSL